MALGSQEEVHEDRQHAQQEGGGEEFRHAEDAHLGEDRLDHGKDEAAEKPTYVSLLGLDAARVYAGELRSDALAALSIFGERATRLTQLADFICHRQF